MKLLNFRSTLRNCLSIPGVCLAWVEFVVPGCGLGILYELPAVMTDSRVHCALSVMLPRAGVLNLLRLEDHLQILLQSRTTTENCAMENCQNSFYILNK